MAGESGFTYGWRYNFACRVMQQQKNLSPLNLSRMIDCSYQTAVKYLKQMVDDGLVEVYRNQYRPNVIAKIYKWIEAENG